MNKLPGKIIQIQQSGAILLVDVEIEHQFFSTLLIESMNKPSWLCTNNIVNLVFKETEVSLAKNLSGQLSIRNRMLCKVQKVEKGVLLSKITLKYKKYTIISAVTTRSVDALQITEGDDIEALVKANEISLMQ